MRRPLSTFAGLLLLLLTAAPCAAQLDERREGGGLRLYRHVLNDLGKSLFFRVALTADDRVAGLELSAE